MPLTLQRFMCLALLGFATPALAECKLRAIAVLPFSSVGAPFVFDAQVNGKAAKLALDVGGTNTALDVGSAQRLGVHMHLSDRPYYGLGGTQNYYYSLIERIQIGGMMARQFRTIGLNLWPGGSPYGLDGNLAMDMLTAYDIDIDAPGHHVIIYDPEGVCLKPTVSLNPPLYATPLVLINEDRQPDVDVEIEGHHLRALLSSDSAHSTMFRSAAERLGVDLSPLSAPGHTVLRGIGVRDVAVMPHVFASMQVGDIRFNNTKIDILDQDGMGVDRNRTGSRLAVDTLTSGHQMVLGADFMNKVHIWISHSSHQLIMQYPPQPSVLPQ